MVLERRDVLSRYVLLSEAMELQGEGTDTTVTGVQWSSFPPMDVIVTDTDVLVQMGLPGGNSDNLSIAVTGDTLVISGAVERQPSGATAGAYRQQEIWQGPFQRSVRLPAQVDSSEPEASFVNGIFALRLPKADAEERHAIRTVALSQSLGRDTVHRVRNGERMDTGDTPPYRDALQYEPSALAQTGRWS